MRRLNSRIIFVLIVLIIGLAYINTKNKTNLPEPEQRITSLEPINQITYFSYPDQHDSIFSTNNLNNKITVADFFFTSCPELCPAMSRYMKDLALTYTSDSTVQFLSISVDPLNDTKSVINNYILSQGLNFDNWFFLESDASSIVSLLEQGFLLSGDGLPGLHSTKFILINSNAEVVGYYDPFSKEEINQLKSDINNFLEVL